MTAVELLPAGKATPDNPQWHELRRATVTASEVAATAGINPWDSAFSLYWRKVNGWDVEETEEMANGRRLEPVVADWWADANDPNEGLAVVRAGLYASEARPWQVATPDRLIYIGCADCTGYGMESWDLGRCGECGGTGLTGGPLAVLECKWTGRWDGWGEPGTDDIPVYYRAQVLWQCDVLGVDEWHLAVLGPGGFRAYRGRRDDKDIRILRAVGAAFHARLVAGDPPGINDHPATGRTLRQLHPSVEDYDVEVPVDLAEGYRRARALRARIERVVDGYDIRIRAAIGSGRRAMCSNRLVASRSVFDKTTDEAELTALEGDWPTVDRLNPGRAATYV